MKTHIPYGRGRLALTLPETAEVLRPAPAMPLPEPERAVTHALRRPIGCRPLHALAAGRRHACIVVSDVTRPVPYRALLPPLLAELEGRVPEITLLVATGTHRPTTRDEKIEMLGADVVARLPVLDHDSRDPAQLQALPGRTTSGAEVHVNRHYLAADLRILTGLVEPHFMAGYSGGRKAVFPGLTDLRAIQRFHGPGFLEHPRAASGILDGNPCHREADDAARLAGVDFILNVTIDPARRILDVFAGELNAAFRAAAEQAGAHSRAVATRPADIVVTSAGGYPLDATFYQTVKGMVGALPVVRTGGTILIASACSEGIGSSEYAELMFRYAGRHDDFLRDIQARDAVEQDQWEFEMQCKALAHVGAEGLILCTDGIPRDTVRRLSVTPAPGPLQDTLDALLTARPDARVAVIPEGPYTLATLRA
ncbi:nickel-dependent lactate racemase [bacterium]|nr:nickel-dependent lactate racemase [bacterium]